VDEGPLKHDLHELMNLVGLGTIKSEIEEMVQLVRFYRDIGKNVRDEFNLHTVFLGNPGTGKTTVARILARIYKNLGVLERGHLVECDRQKLVAGYVGQTAEKTDALIQQAMGGVLFIDEAYSLMQGSQDTYGQEAVATLLKRMEDYRGELVVIVAGYPQEMDQFLNSNPGLRSRFDKTFHFDDYGVEALLEIALSILSKENIRPSADAHAHLHQYLQLLVSNRDKYFGNARSIRKIVEKAIKNQHLRLARMPAAERKPDMLRTLELTDLEEFSLASVPGSNGTVPIGFRRYVAEG
jgi:SpoVK/Ycf46/Vps4 family AAA+-type ATPase